MPRGQEGSLSCIWVMHTHKPHAPHLQIGRELVGNHVVPELLVEGATVGHEGGSQGTVPDEAPLEVRRLFAVLGPTRALAG